jgi:tRNA(His) 5'-end guanylyltransferase
LNEEKKLIENIILNNTGHYNNTLFKQLYFFYSSLTKRGNKLKFIHLKDLSDFASEHLNFTEDLSDSAELHDFSNFPIFINKEDMMDYFKRAYYNDWCTIQTNIKVETFFWELIQKNCEFYEPSTKTS